MTDEWKRERKRGERKQSVIQLWVIAGVKRHRTEELEAE